MTEGKRKDEGTGFDRLAETFAKNAPEWLAKAAGNVLAEGNLGSVAKDVAAEALGGVRAAIAEPILSKGTRARAHALVDGAFDLVRDIADGKNTGRRNLAEIAKAFDDETCDSSHVAELCLILGCARLAAVAERPVPDAPENYEEHRLFGILKTLTDEFLPGWSVASRDGYVRIASPDLRVVSDSIDGIEDRKIVAGIERSRAGKRATASLGHCLVSVADARFGRNALPAPDADEKGT
jgi:hypothetical protein